LPLPLPALRRPAVKRTSANVRLSPYLESLGRRRVSYDVPGTLRVEVRAEETAEIMAETRVQVMA
jgi:hypothetical protein